MNRVRHARCTMVGFVAGMDGMGTTTASESCAIALARRGRRVLFVDAAGRARDAGCDAAPTLVDHLTGRVELAAVVRGSGEEIRRIVAGNLASLPFDTDARTWAGVAASFASLRTLGDVVVVDTGSAQSRTAKKLIALTDHAVVVTDGSTAAVADAYGALKALVQDGLAAPLHLLVNRVASRDEAELVWHRLKSGAMRFLGRELNWLGLLPEDHNVRTATARAEPFFLAFPDTIASEYLDRVVSALERHLPRASIAACEVKDKLEA